MLVPLPVTSAVASRSASRDVVAHVAVNAAVWARCRGRCRCWGGVSLLIFINFLHMILFQTRK